MMIYLDDGVSVFVCVGDVVLSLFHFLFATLPLHFTSLHSSLLFLFGVPKALNSGRKV